METALAYIWWHWHFGRRSRHYCVRHRIRVILMDAWSTQSCHHGKLFDKHGTVAYWVAWLPGQLLSMSGWCRNPRLNYGPISTELTPGWHVNGEGIKGNFNQLPPERNGMTQYYMVLTHHTLQEAMRGKKIKDIKFLLMSSYASSWTSSLSAHPPLHR